MQQQYSTHWFVGRQLESPVPVLWETRRVHHAAGRIADDPAMVCGVYAVVDLFPELVKQALFKPQVVFKINDFIVAGRASNI